MRIALTLHGRLDIGDLVPTLQTVFRSSICFDFRQATDSFGMAEIGAGGVPWNSREPLFFPTKAGKLLAFLGCSDRRAG